MVSAIAAPGAKQLEPAEFRSSLSATCSFYSRCGPPLTYRNDAEPASVDFMTCSLNDPEVLAPDFHVWISHKLAWDHVADGLSAYETTRATGERA